MYRVQKLLSKIGYCSRRSAEQLIVSGVIKINNKVITIGDKWHKRDSLIAINNKEIDVSNALSQVIEIIKYYKPLGGAYSRGKTHITQEQYLIIFLMLKEMDKYWKTRFKYNWTTLFTNDGDLANKVMHPSSSFDREYIVKTDKPITQNSMNSLLLGVPINENQVGKFIKIIKNGKNIYRIILSTGKNREIRNSLKYVNLETLSLKRVKYSKIKLDDMIEGEFRYLTKKRKNYFLI